MRLRGVIVWCVGGMALLSVEATAAQIVEVGGQAVSLTVSEHAGHAVARCLAASP